jgi:hypothetical protein
MLFHNTWPAVLQGTSRISFDERATKRYSPCHLYRVYFHKRRVVVMMTVTVVYRYFYYYWYFYAFHAGGTR